MKKIFLLILLSSFLFTCKTVPLTHRSQLTLIPDTQMQSISFTSYQNFLSTNKPSSSSQYIDQVHIAGKRIQNAVENYLSENKMSHNLKGFEWEFNVVEDKTVNAWCMPGGKVVFYSGIMPLCRDEAGIAVVLGHEVAHAIANHGNERLSHGLVQHLGGTSLALAMQNKPKETQDLFNGLYGLNSNVTVLLPYSKLQESEADHLGLIFMSLAGYDPAEAPLFWERMTAKKGKQMPEYISIHPSYGTRIKNLRKWMPEAMKYYKPRS